MLTVKRTFESATISQLDEVGRFPGRWTSVNDQDEVGFANSERCAHERRLTVNTDCMHTYDKVMHTYDKVMHRTITKRDEYGTKHEKTGRSKTEPRG